MGQTYEGRAVTVTGPGRALDEIIADRYADFLTPAWISSNRVKIDRFLDLVREGATEGGLLFVELPSWAREDGTFYRVVLAAEGIRIETESVQIAGSFGTSRYYVAGEARYEQVSLF